MPLVDSFHAVLTSPQQLFPLVVLGVIHFILFILAIFTFVTYSSGLKRSPSGDAANILIFAEGTAVTYIACIMMEWLIITLNLCYRDVVCYCDKCNPIPDEVTETTLCVVVTSRAVSLQAIFVTIARPHAADLLSTCDAGYLRVSLSNYVSRASIVQRGFSQSSTP